MASKINKEILESYLFCRIKGYLKLTGQQGIKHDYENMLIKMRNEVKLKSTEKIIASRTREETPRNVPLCTSALKEGRSYILGATLEDDHFCLSFDGLKRVDGPSKLGDFHYIPMLFHQSHKIGKEKRQLLELLGFLLSRIQERTPSAGIIWHGKECRASRIRLGLDLRKTERLFRSAKEMPGVQSSTSLILNDHCHVCEFRQRCYDEAIQQDNLSLLRGMAEKEIQIQNGKGIFTVTQFAHTFRPRRRPKRAAQQSKKRYHALQAMALRDKTIYVFGTPEPRHSPVRIYFDIESDPEEKYVYLIGMIIVDNGTEKQCSFWADSKDKESEIFADFLDEIGHYENFLLFCYGAYERAFLKRMRKMPMWEKEVDCILSVLVNTLSLIYAHFYFPTYSNGLKDVGACLGCSWSDPEASGIQSVVWRERWEATGYKEWKQKLTTYNCEDCAALKVVTELIYLISEAKEKKEETPRLADRKIPISHVQDLDKLGNDRKWGKVDFFHPEYERINNCAYFDYQRERVFVRTNRRIKRNKAKTEGSKNRKLRVSQRIHVSAEKCPSCQSTELTDSVDLSKVTCWKPRVKRAFDLIHTPAGIRRKVIICRTSVHQCLKCGHAFAPDEYAQLDKHFHGLKSWAMYQHVVHQQSLGAIESMLEEFFGIRVFDSEIHMFKSLMARYYQETHEYLLAKILAGNLLHVDETEVKLRQGKGYVWVFSNLEEVLFIYRPTREGDFLQELLKDFRGVLVSDFYTAYDSVRCPQQKCLIHLIRDMNQLLLSHAYDEELRSITNRFGILLRSVVETIDQHGLKKRYLKKHHREVGNFCEDLTTRCYDSDVVESLRERLVRNQDKLWTFLSFDGVPWNNNNAEHAIKRFAYYREKTVGTMGESGLKDYLLLLSLCETCRYKGVSFLKFLLSRKTDIDDFCERQRPIRPDLGVEVYPAGFVPPHFHDQRRSRSTAQHHETAEEKGGMGISHQSLSHDSEREVSDSNPSSDTT